MARPGYWPCSPSRGSPAVDPAPCGRLGAQQGRLLGQADQPARDLPADYERPAQLPAGHMPSCRPSSSARVTVVHLSRSSRQIRAFMLGVGNA
jgi:hypothetical protein